MKRLVYLFSLTTLVLILACTPKTDIVAPSPEPEEAPTANTAESVDPRCATFEQSGNSEEALTAYVLYRDFLKAKEYDQAFAYWQKTYSMAPAADGQRNTVLADGIVFYEYFMQNTTDAALKNRYVDTIFSFYDQIGECFGEIGYVAGRKAFDSYYKYKGKASDDEIYAMFKASADADGEDMQYFIVNPFSSFLVKQYQEGKIDMATAQKYTHLLLNRIDKGLEDKDNGGQWEIIANYAPRRLEAFESEKGFFDCAFYKDKYGNIDLDSASCDDVNELIGRLRFADCPEADSLLAALDNISNTRCKVVVKSSAGKLGYEALRNGEYAEAVSNFEQAANETDDPERKAKFLLLVAKTYYAHLKQFSQARKFALQAAEVKPNWGEPFLIIGRMYASSGPLCGPGRGWDSQIVVWPAIDKWNYAKQIDPSVAAEANKWINTYAQYMPGIEDIFQRTLKVGDTFRVPCWIQENTKIRAAKK